MSVLNVEDVTMRFGGLTALSNINLKVNKGEIVGVIGPNGAGKTTLFNVVTGMYTPTEGKVFLSEKDVTGMKPYLIAREGFARTFQNLRLFGRLSVRDNVISAMSEIHKISVFDALLNTNKNESTNSFNDISPFLILITSLNNFDNNNLFESSLKAFPLFI